MRLHLRLLRTVRYLRAQCPLFSAPEHSLDLFHPISSPIRVSSNRQSRKHCRHETS